MRSPFLNGLGTSLLPSRVKNVVIDKRYSSTPNEGWWHSTYWNFASVTRPFSWFLGGAWGWGKQWTRLTSGVHVEQCFCHFFLVVAAASLIFYFYFLFFILHKMHVSITMVRLKNKKQTNKKKNIALCNLVFRCPVPSLLHCLFCRWSCI